MASLDTEFNDRKTSVAEESHERLCSARAQVGATREGQVGNACDHR